MFNFEFRWHQAYTINDDKTWKSMFCYIAFYSLFLFVLTYIRQDMFLVSYIWSLVWTFVWLWLLHCKTTHIDFGKLWLAPDGAYLCKQAIQIVKLFIGGKVVYGFIANVCSCKMLTGWIKWCVYFVQGLAPAPLLSTERIEYPEKVFYVGQVVRCKVISVSPEEGRLKLTFVVGWLKWLFKGSK